MKNNGKKNHQKQRTMKKNEVANEKNEVANEKNEVANEKKKFDGKR